MEIVFGTNIKSVLNVFVQKKMVILWIICFGVKGKGKSIVKLIKNEICYVALVWFKYYLLQTLIVMSSM